MTARKRSQSIRSEARENLLDSRHTDQGRILELVDNQFRCFGLTRWSAGAWGHERAEPRHREGEAARPPDEREPDVLAVEEAEIVDQDVGRV